MSAPIKQNRQNLLRSFSCSGGGSVVCVVCVCVLKKWYVWCVQVSAHEGQFMSGVFLHHPQP